MPDGPVVVNNTPLVALWTVGRLDLLRDLFQEVLIPRAVEEEFLAAETAARRDALVSSPWVKRVDLRSRQDVVYAGLDKGEAEVLALAKEQGAHLVILDERKARRYAKQIGLPISGTVGVLPLSKEAGLIDSIRPWLSKLQKAGLHLSPTLIEEALGVADEHLRDDPGL
jgi:predicted nucleic acid-binding protein